MQKYTLSAVKRTISGHKVTTLRKQGLIPGNIYGRKVPSKAVQVDLKDFGKTFSKARESGLVELTLGAEKIPVLIHNVQYHPVTDIPLHVDFLQVNLKEKVTTKVPVILVGEALAVKDKAGVLLQLLSEIMIEALPTDLPEKIELDVTKLKAVNDVIKVSDLKVSDKVKVLTDATYDVVKVAPLVSKEAEKMAAEAAAAQAAAAAAQAAAATAAPSAEAGGAPAGGAAPEKAATPAGSSPKAS